MNVCVLCECSPWRTERVLDPLEVELQGSVRCLMVVLGSELLALGNNKALNYEPSFQPLHISFSQAGILLATMRLLICFLSWRKMTWHRQQLFRNTRRPVYAFIRVRNFTLLTQTELTDLQSLQRLC